jgi:hypothetical protein
LIIIWWLFDRIFPHLFDDYLWLFVIICDYFCSEYLKLFVVIQNYSVIICDYLRPLFVIICKYLIIILFWLFVIICNYFWLFDDYLVMIIRDYLMIIRWLFGLNYSWLFVIIWCPGQQQVGRAGSLQKAFAFHRGTSWWLHLCDGARSHDRFFHIHAPGNDCIKARTTPTLLERSCNTYTRTPAPIMLRPPWNVKHIWFSLRKKKARKRRKQWIE